MASRLDRLTKSTAVALSRRGFLKRVPLMGAAVGLGLAVSATPAYACTPPWTETRTTHGACGGCGPHNRWNFHQRRTCMQCTGGEVCGTWATYKEDCSVC